MRHGFTLVELSIVLAILGLLIGGTTLGVSFIRSAEVQGIVKEHSSFAGGLQAFREKYNSTPGDFRTATRYFGLQMSGSGCVSYSGVSSTSDNGSCDGNGDGILDSPSVVGATGETFQFWRQMMLGGQLEGSFSGLGGSAGYNHSVPGSNVPKGRVSGSGYSVFNAPDQPGGTTGYFQGTYGTTLYFGSASPTTLTYNAALRPREALAIDTKMDDGKPGMGTVFGGWVSPCTDGATGSVLTADYNVQVTNIACNLMFRNFAE